MQTKPQERQKKVMENNSCMEKIKEIQEGQVGHWRELGKDSFIFFIWREGLHSNQGPQQLWASVTSHLGDPPGCSGDQSKCDLCMSDSQYTGTLTVLIVTCK